MNGINSLKAQAPQLKAVQKPEEKTSQENKNSMKTSTKVMIGAAAVATAIIAGIAIKNKAAAKALEKAANEIKEKELKIPDYVNKFMDGIDKESIVTKRLRNGKSTITFPKDNLTNILIFDKSGKCTNLLTKNDNGYEYFALGEKSSDKKILKKFVKKGSEIGEFVVDKYSPICKDGFVDKVSTIYIGVERVNPGGLRVERTTYRNGKSESFTVRQFKDDQVNLRQTFQSADGEKVRKWFRDGKQVDNLTQEEKNKMLGLL